MAMAIPIVMIAGAAISAYGAMEQAKAGKQAATYNAQLRERDATVALDQSSQDAERFNRKYQQEQGSMLAGYGASGVGLEGSPMDVLRMSATNAKLDEETILYKGRLKATGYHDDAFLNRMAGDTAMKQGTLNASSYLISGAGKAGYTYAGGMRGTTGSQIPLD